MPITSKMSKDDTFHELRHGKTFKKTAEKHGKKTADKQMVAIAAKEGKLKKAANRKKRNKGRA
jgi:hypothetical protein